jgi:hypothetical protein
MPLPMPARARLPRRLPLIVLVAALAAAGGRFSAAAQDPPASPAGGTPAPGQTTVIAQERFALPNRTAGWSVTRLAANVEEPDDPEQFFAGYLLADTVPVRVLPEDGDPVTIEPGGAYAIADQTELKVVSAESTTGSLYALTVAEAAVVREALGGTFEIDRGDYDLTLFGGALAPGGSATLQATDFPAVVLVTLGQASFQTDTAEPVTLTPGNGFGFSGTGTLSAGETNGLVFVAITISTPDQPPATPAVALAALAAQQSAPPG